MKFLLSLFSFLYVSSAFSICCDFGLQSELLLGWREDSATWSVPGHREEDPDIVTEVAWKDLRMVQVGANVKVCGLGNVYARGSGDYAWIYHGVKRDTDTWSRETLKDYYHSFSNQGEGETYDLSAGFGAPFIRTSSFMLSPIAGYSYMQQHLYMFDGKQLISFGRPDLVGDSQHHSRWKGPWAGFDAMISLGGLTLEGEWEYHWTRFFGKRDWNLRRDLMNSFSDVANGHGHRYNLRALYSCYSCLSFGVGVDYWDFHAHGGKTEVALPVFLLDEEGEALPSRDQCVEFSFKEVSWRSFRVNGVISLSF